MKIHSIFNVFQSCLAIENVLSNEKNSDFIVIRSEPSWASLEIFEQIHNETVGWLERANFEIRRIWWAEQGVVKDVIAKHSELLDK